ncbi:MAG: histidinol dehydrogenase [Gammaproteobacteria bacterium]
MADLIKRLDAASADFDAELKALLAWDEDERPEVGAIVREIIAAVKAEGDAALLRYTNRFDRRAVSAPAALEERDFSTARTRIPAELHDALEQAAARIRRYHEKQKAPSWDYAEADGTRLGQQITALDRVGIYVPGGKAAYPSSVLMNAIPAKVAGVNEIVMAVPAPDEHLEPVVLAAAAIAGVDRVFTIGGAQAIAALAYGTATVPAVDKIVGPGNIYVATAKSLVFGRVGIDMIAGPSEILIICDGHTPPDWTAMDLFSQAEHDEQAQAILLCPDGAYLDAVEASLRRLLPTLGRASIAQEALATRGALIRVADLPAAVDLANRIAPEHLELSVDEPRQWLPHIRHAGAIFLGRHSPEALGDYCAGPNHVLPTAGTARFSSPLGVYDFQKRSSVIECSAAGAAALAPVARILAESEGLDAHAKSARYRAGDV